MKYSLHKRSICNTDRYVKSAKVKNFLSGLFLLLFVVIHFSTSAQITVVGISTTATGTNSVTIAKPAGVQVGDLMIVNLQHTDIDNPTYPAGWIERINYEGGSGSTRARVAYKIAVASDVSATNYVFADNDWNRVAAGLSVFRGVNTTTNGGINVLGNPIDADNSTVTIQPPSITTTAANSMVLFFSQLRLQNLSFNADWKLGGVTGTPMNQLYVQNAPNIPDGCGVSGAFFIQPTAGVTGNGYQTTGTGTARRAGILMALTPVSCPSSVTNTTTTASINEGTTKTLTATPAGGVFSVVSGGGTIAGTTYTAPLVNANTNVIIRYTLTTTGCPTLTSDIAFTVTDIAGVTGLVYVSANCAAVTGEISVYGVTGGTQPYNFRVVGPVIVPFQVSPEFSGLQPGTYEVRVRDANNVVTTIQTVTLLQDTDGDGVANECDQDKDNDGLVDNEEGCPFFTNSAFNPNFAILTQSSSGNIIAVDLITGESFTLATLGFSFNATAFNENTGRLWGVDITNSNSTNLRIKIVDPANNWSVTDNFLVPKPFGSTSNSVVGAFNAVTRRFILLGEGGQFVIQIDANPASPTYKQIVQSVVPPSTLGIIDWAVDTRNQNMLYGLSYISNSQTDMIRYDLVNNTITNLGTVSGILTETAGYGAAYSQRDGILYFGNNASGRIYKVDLTVSATAATLFSVGPTAGNNDGAKLFSFEPSTPCSFDSDLDGVADYLDSDSDNDGVPDALEANASLIPSQIEVNGNLTGAVNLATGIKTLAGSGLTPVDSDGDGKPNFQDIDSDNDGIVDVIESQPTIGYIVPTGVVNSFGVDNAFNTVGSGELTTTLTNTDGTDLPDMLDTDSDNDGISDVIEANQGAFAIGDLDIDGLANMFDNVALSVIPTSNSTNGGQTANNPFPDTNNPGSEPNWRDKVCTQLPNLTTATNFASIGISTHTTKQANWPSNVANGAIVLESTNKGFVITRLTTAARDASSFMPVEGMLIYNTTANRFQLYTNGAWVNLKRGCNN